MTNNPNPTGDKPVVMPELLPCPFCGSPAELSDLGDPQDDSMVNCTNQRGCGMQQIARFTPEGAVAAWNTRHREQDTLSREGREALERIARCVFLAAHADGWRGNQLRRDVQHVDAEKSWALYVENGALRMAVNASLSTAPTSPEQADQADVLRERIAELEAENDRLSKAVGSGILRDLLNDEEQDEFVKFIKFLRSSPEARAALKAQEG